MKLVIHTQIRENYGDASKPHWKNKFGDTYVVPGLTQRQIDRIRKGGIPTLKGLIERRDDYYQETIVDWGVVEDDAQVCEAWDSPCELSYNGAWTMKRITINDEYGSMRQEIERKVEHASMLPGGERDNYRVQYVMTNGDRVAGGDIQQYLAEISRKEA